jgi:prostaglandin-H2 D-isomerase / glutathione transferase
MSDIKLTYFDISGGRAEATRLALHIGGIDFEDHRISFAEFGEIRENAPFKAVPLLEINGGTYTQSNSMNRYFGRLAGLYPDDPWQAFLCDEIMDVIEDAVHFIVQTFSLKDEALQTAREKLISDRYIPYLHSLAERLQNAGGEYFANQSLTVADLKVFIWVRGLMSGHLDHIPVDLVANHAPSLVDHFERVNNHPAIVDYYKD